MTTNLIKTKVFPFEYYKSQYDDGERLRWKVIVNTKDGGSETIYVEELQELIENGPAWDTDLDRIIITYNH